MTEEEFYHKQHIDLLSNHLLENDWVWIYKKYHKVVEDVDIYYRYFSYLATPTDAAKSLRSATCDIQENERVTLMGDYSYRPFANPGFENLVTIRDFYISNEHFVDIRVAEEIIFYFRLFEYRENNGEIKFYRIENSFKILVCVITNDSVKILNRYLIEFMAAKRMDLICCCQSEVEFDLDKIDIPFKIKGTQGKFEDISPNLQSNYRFCVGLCFAKIQSWFNGKTILNHTSLKKIMEKEQRYISYVIGTASDGTSLDSDESTNQYTSVFFDKEVLTLYHGRQGCKIEPLRISSPDFSLRCDNDNLDYVVVFLRDIQDLPYKEQYKWRGYNIVPDGRGFSNLFQKTIIDGNWNGAAQSIDFIFRDLYRTLVSKWELKYGWKLFKPLNGLQAEYFNQICLLSRNDYEDLTNLVKYLALFLQESLNLDEFEKITPAIFDVKDKIVNGETVKESHKEGPIAHLHRVLERLNTEDAEFVIFLRNLQSLRSYMLHRNRETLEKDKRKAFVYFGLNEDKSNSQLASKNIFQLGANALSTVIKQL